MSPSHAQLAAENVFLREPLACDVEREVRPNGADNASRSALVVPSRFVARRELLTIVRPATVVRWRRDVFLLCWRAKSRLTSLATPWDGRGSCTERGSNPGAANGSLQIIESVGLMRKGFAGARNQ